MKDLRFASNIRHRTILFPGIGETLDALDQRGVRWGVVTNKTEALASQLLSALDLASRCGCIVGRDTGYLTTDDRPDSWGATELADSPFALMGILDRWGLSP